MQKKAKPTSTEKCTNLKKGLTQRFERVFKVNVQKAQLTNVIIKMQNKIFHFCVFRHLT